MTRTIFAVAAFAALFAPAVAASVNIDAMVPTLSGDVAVKRTVVNFDDLNPADAKDAAILYGRLDAAVAALCISNPGGTSALIARPVATCRTKALTRAIEAVDAPALTSVAAAK